MHRDDVFQMKECTPQIEVEATLCGEPSISKAYRRGRLSAWHKAAPFTEAVAGIGIGIPLLVLILLASSVVLTIGWIPMTLSTICYKLKQR